MDLRAVRELAAKTQHEVAESSGLAQSEVSRIAHRDDYRFSTLKRYVEALGAELEVRAVFDDKAVKLHL